MTSPLYAANNFIAKSNEQNVNLTHLKLQKLLYILYARYLKVANASLFSDRFVAWKYGPVLTEIYDTFKDEDSNRLTELRNDPNGLTKVIVNDGLFGKCFNEVWEKYGRKSASELVNTTHEKGSAWSIASENGSKLGGFLEDVNIRKDGETWFE